MTRRSFLAAILAAGVAPAVVRAASLMPVRVLDSGIALPSFVEFSPITTDAAWLETLTFSFTPTRQLLIVPGDVITIRGRAARVIGWGGGIGGPTTYEAVTIPHNEPPMFLIPDEYVER